ncbi:Fe-Mn family superoxide dismutase [Candidatus Parcubacteria bacterium]|nr:Fe-Mn family superoxide dismutase [Candidatus Parcubacteria bacterium]
MYQAKTFNLPALDGISPKQIEVHLKLYAGYVTFLNKLEETLAELMKDSEKNAYALGEVQRRRGFEFDGMRMHEYYFSQLEGGASPLEGSLADALAAQYGSLDTFLATFKATALMRGIGWSILYYDTDASRFHIAWVSDHELGQLAGLPILLALDMWEHAFMVDYVPAEKKNYVEAFFKNLNWNAVQARYASLQA